MNLSRQASGAMPLHAEAACDVSAQPSSVFEYIDQPQRLSAHMERRTWQLGGGSMAIETDSDGGRAVGSHIHLAGRMLGIPLSVECKVIRREPPRLKSWQTVSEPRLLVIGAYRMTVHIDVRGDRSHAVIAIDYALPACAAGRALGTLFGSMYARWCVGQMTRDLVNQFGTRA